MPVPRRHRVPTTDNGFRGPHSYFHPTPGVSSARSVSPPTRGSHEVPTHPSARFYLLGPVCPPRPKTRHPEQDRRHGPGLHEDPGRDTPTPGRPAHETGHCHTGTPDGNVGLPREAPVVPLLAPERPPREEIGGGRLRGLRSHAGHRGPVRRGGVVRLTTDRHHARGPPESPSWDRRTGSGSDEPRQ